MASVNLINSCLDSIRQISDQITDSIVYLDSGFAEAFQFIGAFPLLLELGVCAVCSLENVSPLDICASWTSNSQVPSRKVAIMTSRLLSDAHRYILRCLATHKTVLHCTVFTSISEVSHSTYVDSPLGPDAFHEYEALLLQDYEELLKKSDRNGIHLHQHSESRKPDEFGHLKVPSQNEQHNIDMSLKNDLFHDEPINVTEAESGSERLVASVCHFPMVLCPLSPRVFVLPSEGTIAEACLSNDSEDSLSPGLPSISTGLSSDGDDFPPGATLTAHFLYHLATKLDLKMEIFSLGDTSKVVGKMLTDMSSLYDVGRRNKKSAGLLLIDRTLDLLTPCCHGDSFLDRMMCSLQRSGNSSTLTTKSSQASSAVSSVRVQRAPLHIKIPFETIFSSDEPALNSAQLFEGIEAFLSGWKRTGVGFESTHHVDEDNSSPLNQESDMLRGSFLSNYTGATYLETLLDRRAKDGVMLIKKWLLEALQHEKIYLNSKGRLSLASVSELHTMIKKLARDQMYVIRNRGIMKLARAAEIALNEIHSSHWDAFASAEKILTISSVDSTQGLSSQICDFINTSILVKSAEHNKMSESSQTLLSLQDALLLSMIGYILAGENFPSTVSTGPFSWEEEHSLKEAIVEAILEKPASAKFRFLKGLENELEANSKKGTMKENDHSFAETSQVEDFDEHWGSWDDEDADNQDQHTYDDMQLKLELRDRVDQLFKFFNKLSSLKWRNPTLREGLVSSSKYAGDADTRKGLLYKLLTTILAKYDIPGLEYHSSAVGRFLKSGFGRFGLGQAKPSFGDQSVLIIFVVGGINSLEVREAMEAVTENGRPDVELILGGTTLLTPNDMFDLLLGSSSCI